MRTSQLSGVVVGLFAIAACGATSPRAAADPRAATQPQGPLIPAELGAPGDAARALREYYTKYEYRIPMRDGVHLYTVAYVPRDHARTYPILLKRTPYGVAPYGADNYPDPANNGSTGGFAPSAQFIREGYIFCQQDVRGRMMSEGDFAETRPHTPKAGVDEVSDAWDTIDFLVKHLPGNNGKVGVWGVSYSGFYAAQAAIDAHPALKAVSPQAPVTDWFTGDDVHHNGAFFLAQSFDFLSSFGKPRTKLIKKASWGFDYDAGDAYDFFLRMGPVSNADATYLKGQVPFWNDVTSHGQRDAFWNARDPRPFYKDAKPAVMVVGGWFDAEDLWGSLATYRAFESQSPHGNVSLVMGPWRHGGWRGADGDHLGDVRFDSKTAQFYQKSIELAFFEHHLKGKATPLATEAWVFETGTNAWERYDAWPPRFARAAALYFGPNEQLTTVPPTTAGPMDADTWVSDPAKPVPYRDAPSITIASEYMTGDQRFAARRPDVVTYTTAVLSADVTLAGPLEADLWVSTTGTDSDFIVKVVDVYPHDVADPEPNPTGVRMGGYQQLVRGEVMRGKFRTSFEHPEPFTPAAPTHLRFALPDINHTFRSGHKLMVQVQSSWFPLVDRNPQTFTDIYHAKPEDFRMASQRLYRSKNFPSSVRVTLARGVLP